MSEQVTEKRLSLRATNILLNSSVAILLATVLLRYLPLIVQSLPFGWGAALTRSPQVSALVQALNAAPQEGFLVAMGIGVFLFLLVAFDQPD